MWKQESTRKLVKKATKMVLIEEFLIKQSDKQKCFIIADIKKRKILGKMNFYVHQIKNIYSQNEMTNNKISAKAKIGQFVNIRLFTKELNSVKSYYWINPKNVINSNVLKLTKEEAKYFLTDKFRGDHFVTEKQKSGDMHVNSGYDQYEFFAVNKGTNVMTFAKKDMRNPKVILNLVTVTLKVE